MTDAVFSGSPDPGKQIFNFRNLMMVIGVIGAGSWALLMWNVKEAVDDIHTAVTTSNSAMSLSVSNKDSIDRMSRTESRLANIAVDHKTRMDIMEDHLHIVRTPSLHVYDGGGGNNR